MAGAGGFCSAGPVLAFAWTPDMAHSRASAFDRFSTCVSWARSAVTTWARPGCSLGIGMGLTWGTSMRQALRV